MVRPGRKRRRPAVGPCHKVQRSGRHPHRSGGRGARPEKPAPGIRRPRRRCGACRCRAGRMPRRPPSVEVRPRATIRPPGGILWPGGLPRCLPLAIWRPPRPSVAPSLGGTMRTSPWRRGLCRRGSGSTSPTSTPSPAGATISPTRRPARRRLDAFEQDQRRTRYDTREELADYCRRSADPVGRVVLALEGCRDRELVSLSDSICTGLQLVNFWQDIRRDRLAGRVYLPGHDMVRHGVDEAMLDEPAASPPLRRLVADEVEWARRCFDLGAPLVRRAPAVLRPAIGMFLGGGRAVADAIERAAFDTLSRRPVVGRMRKAALAARAWWGTLTAARDGA